MRKPRGAGKFNQKITLVDRTTFEDLNTLSYSGEKVTEDSLIEANVWCSVKFIGTPSAGASEDNTDDQRTGKSKIEVELRYREDVSHEDYIIYMGGVFEIYSIQESGRDDTILLRGEARDDDGFTIAVADEYTEEFYLANPSGNLEEDSEVPNALINQFKFIGDGKPNEIVIKYRFDGPMSEMPYRLILPIDWFNNRAKSGRGVQPNYDDRAKPWQIAGELEVTDPTEYIDYFSDGVGNTNGAFYFFDQEYPPQHVVEVSADTLHEDYKVTIPSNFMSYSNINNRISFPYTFNDPTISQNLSTSKEMFRVQPVLAYPKITDPEAEPELESYVPSVAVQPTIVGPEDANRYMISFTPHYFGGTKASIYIRAHLVRGYFIGDQQNFSTAKFVFEQTDVTLKREGAYPFFDLSRPNALLYPKQAIESYGVTEDGIPDFDNPIADEEGTYTCYSDYWRVKVYNGSEEGTSKLEVNMRYDKMGFATNSVPGFAYYVDTVTTFEGNTLEVYPVNMYTRSLALDAYITNTTYAAAWMDNQRTAPEGFEERKPNFPYFMGTVDFSGPPNALGGEDYDLFPEPVHDQFPNIATEDMIIRPKNFRVVVRRLDLPEDWVYGDELVYKEIEIPLDMNMEVDQNPMFLNHRYVFDNIPTYLHDDDKAIFKLKFDVEYDFDNRIQDEELVFFHTNEQVYNEETSSYEDIGWIDDDPMFDAIQESMALDLCQVGRKGVILPRTVPFELIVPKGGE